MGERNIEVPASHVVWTYTEEEFKRLLGITDAQGVLRVSVNFIYHSVAVELSKNE